ncbi:Nascent polypeptide-associated complex subunit alpha [Dictyocoela muelleri]|nr:Nascent polypeptide-associated complex subunit alpha [Dictyocoela muelleri]
MRELIDSEKEIYTQLTKFADLTEQKEIKKFAIFKNLKKYIAKEPLVYKVKGTETYIVFGQLLLDFDIETLKKQFESIKLNKNEVKEDVEDGNNEVKEAKEDGINEVKEDVEDKSINNPSEIDMTKINEDDVKVIMSQKCCTRDEALKILAESQYDLVNALLKINK